MRNKNHIYKYTTINDFTYKNLILSQLRFNPPTSMNDQLEGMIKVSNPDFKPSKKAIENFIEDKQLGKHFWYMPRQDDFLDFYMSYWFRFELTRFRISCFSKVATESLMWAHYANKHSGICLVYDKNILIESLRDVDSTFKLIPINYGIKPIVSLLEKKKRIGYESDIPIISAKDSNWKYEKEIRIYNEHDYNENINDSFYIPNSALVGIIYGYQISDSDKDAISVILGNESHYSHVYEADEQIDFESGKIVIEQNNS
jgi:hypothetical protein